MNSILTEGIAMQIDAIFLSAAQYFLAIIFLLASLHKTLNWRSFVGTVKSYRLLPECFASTTAIIITGIEWFLVLLLVSHFSNILAGMLAMGLFGLYFAAMGINIFRGHTAIDCGCSFTNREAPLSLWHLLRNAILFGLSFLMTLPQSSGYYGLFEQSQAILASVCLAVLYLAFESMIENRIYLLQEEL